MKFFLSSRYSRKDELIKLRDKLEQMGHDVTSRWLDTNWEERDEHWEPSVAPPEYREKYAQIDLQDVSYCDCLVCFTDPPGQGGRRGGKHVEFGYAMGLGKKVIIVGPRENIFHCHPKVTYYIDVESWFLDMC